MGGGYVEGMRFGLAARSREVDDCQQALAQRHQKLSTRVLAEHKTAEKCRLRSYCLEYDDGVRMLS